MQTLWDIREKEGEVFRIVVPDSPCLVFRQWVAPDWYKSGGKPWLAPVQRFVATLKFNKKSFLLGPSLRSPTISPGLLFCIKDPFKIFSFGLNIDGTLRHSNQKPFFSFIFKSFVHFASARRRIITGLCPDTFQQGLTSCFDSRSLAVYFKLFTFCACYSTSSTLCTTPFILTLINN